MKYDIIIIGAGASGLMCAVEAAKRGRSVAIIEHNKDPGNKILVSGGGHCNFSNLNCEADNYISDNPHFVKSALSRFTPNAFMKMLDQHDIKYEEKTSGQMFCKGSSRNIISMMMDECRRHDVIFHFNSTIASIARSEGFSVNIDDDRLKSTSLVVATGGPSYPELGASDYGLKIAKQFGMEVMEFKPALVPMIFHPNDREHYSKLSGVSFSGRVSLKKRRFDGDVLFTHRGLTGPAVLQISSYWNDGDELMIDIFPNIDIHSLILDKRDNSGKMLIKNFLTQHINKSFAHTLCEIHDLSEQLNSYSEKKLQNICKELHEWRITPAGTEGYRRAHAMKGGVDTKDISSKTMESKKVKGLYFIGEVLDVVGHLGGYNLQWAWSSGFTAGQHA